MSILLVIVGIAGLVLESTWADRAGRDRGHCFVLFFKRQTQLGGR